MQEWLDRVNNMSAAEHERIYGEFANEPNPFSFPPRPRGARAARFRTAADPDTARGACAASATSATAAARTAAADAAADAHRPARCARAAAHRCQPSLSAVSAAASPATPTERMCRFMFSRPPPTGTGA